MLLLMGCPAHDVLYVPGTCAHVHKVVKFPLTERRVKQQKKVFNNQIGSKATEREGVVGHSLKAFSEHRQSRMLELVEASKS